MKKIISLKVSLDGEDRTGIISDGYHTFDELYDHRITLYIALCRERTNAAEEGGFDSLVWRSYVHHDGTSFGGWFILGMNKKKGEQITYHVPNERWHECDFAETLEIAPEFDGHSSADVLERLKKL